MVDEILSALPPRERAERYRDLARQAREQAPLTKGEIQLFLIKQAGDWAQLAIEAEQEAKAKGYDFAHTGAARKTKLQNRVR